MAANLNFPAARGALLGTARTYDKWPMAWSDA